NTGFFAPRAFQDDTPGDRRAIQDVISLIDAYPLAEFDGKMKKHDWSKLPHFPQPESGGGETKWVFPETFFDQLPLLLDDCDAAARRGAAVRRTAGVDRGGAEGSETQGGDDRRSETRRPRAGRATVRVPQLRAPARSQLDHSRQRRDIRHRLLH